jgi:hypothetical protein
MSPGAVIGELCLLVRRRESGELIAVRRVRVPEERTMP